MAFLTHPTSARRTRLAGALSAMSLSRLAPDDELAIAEVRAWPIREPSSGRRYTVLRLQSRSGLAGFGECETLSSDDLAWASKALPGRPATAVESLANLLEDRPALNAAVNIASLDLAARFAKVPLYQYLGGPTRHKVRVMTRLDTASAARPAGFNAFILPAPARDARKQLDALRAQLGPNIDFVLDTSAANLSPREAAHLCRDLETFHPYWIDEPCSAANVPAARRLSGESVTPLGFGRTLESTAAFEGLLREEAIDVLRPSLALHGISAIRKLSAMAETRYVAVAPFHDGGPVATAAAIHLAASIPNFFIQQIPAPSSAQDREMRASLAGPTLESPRDGFLPLPPGPGLGITPDPSTLDRYLEASR
jgi:galactonate dehydratase